MDQGLKERLVGAAVLVAIGVWLIPWVLDGPENPVDSGSPSLQLPAAEEPVPMRTRTLRLGEGEAEAAPVVADEPPVTATPPPAVETAVAAEPPPAATERSAPAAAPPPPTRAPVASAPAGDWVVQLGAFSEEATARKLAQRSGTFGYPATVSTVRSGGRTLYRVRVGPLATRGQADAAASALTAHGLSGKVVAAD